MLLQPTRAIDVGPPGEAPRRARREKLTQLGLEIVSGRSQDFAQLISRESRKWADVAKRADIRPD